MLNNTTASGNAARSMTIVLSGRVCAGKTSLASALEAFGFQRVSTRSLLLALVAEGTVASRTDLQRMGAHLDANLGGRWVGDAVARMHAPGKRIVVDAIRTIEQRAALATLSPMVHCHLWASPEVLAHRHELRQQEAPEFEAAGYSRLCQSATEAAIDELASAADVVLNTERFTPRQLATAAAALFQLV